MIIKDIKSDKRKDCYISANDIVLHSVEQNRIVLPYKGPVPKWLADMENPRILFNIQPDQYTVLFYGECQNGLTPPLTVDASRDEIVDLLLKFFKNPNRNMTGLTPYWEGVWQGLFDGFLRMTDSVVNFLPALGTYSLEQQDMLIMFISRSRRQKI